MAGGKTFHGLGEIESAFRDDALEGDDVRGVYSGPTVVDDDKVEEGLKKLRSLDQPPGPLTGVTEVVVDSSSSAKTQIAELPTQGRPTAVGHSLGTPQVGQTIASDPLRGTMFGHSIHLPDVNSPEDVAEELSSGALMVTEPSGPHPLGPFPLADGATRPQGALGPLGPRAEPLRPAGDGMFPQAEPFRRPNNFRIPEDTTDQLFAPRTKSLQRIALGFVAAGVIAVGLVVWQQVRESGSDPEPAPPAATADPAPAPAAEPAAAAAPGAAEAAPSPTTAAAPSPTAAAQPPREPEPAASAKPAAAPAPRQRSSSRTAAEPTETKAPEPAAAEEPAAAAPAATAPPATAEEEAPAPAKPASRRRRGSRAGAADDDQAAPSRPARAAKPKVEEDPDATLPPSLD